MPRIRHAILFAFLILTAIPPRARAQKDDSADFVGKEIEDKRPGEAPGPEYSRIRGVNYVAGYAASPYQMWADYNAERVRLDLSRARGIGFNSVRVWLSYLAFEEKPSGLVANFKDFMEACQAEGLTVTPILFDGWGITRSKFQPAGKIEGAPGGGDDRTETTKQAYDRFLSRPDAYRLDDKLFRRQMHVIAETIAPKRPVPFSANDPSAAFWGEWWASPGAGRQEKANWPRYRDYVKEVIEPMRESPFILAWDVMNQPDTARMFDKTRADTKVHEFVFDMIRAAREAKPIQPITVGAAGGWAGARVYAKKVDLISVEFIQRPGVEMTAELREARKQGKPVLVSMIGGAMFPSTPDEATDEGQRQIVRKSLLQLQRERTGCYLWQLVEGESITPWAGLMKRNGDLKPAAQWLKGEFWR